LCSSEIDFFSLQEDARRELDTFFSMSMSMSMGSGDDTNGEALYESDSTTSFLALPAVPPTINPSAKPSAAQTFPPSSSPTSTPTVLPSVLTQKKLQLIEDSNLESLESLDEDEAKARIGSTSSEPIAASTSTPLVLSVGTVAGIVSAAVALGLAMVVLGYKTYGPQPPKTPPQV
jgi:hypothetical protein